ncbi:MULTISPECIES: M23 family metallopeptidase [Rheinheimera]|uniref:M23 family metallopeptidase n=1 Tax=Rheinheimera marina TaxID=1774958 RepID=A0ABV9JIH4_9GAMM
MTFVHPLPGAKISSGFANYVLKSRGRKHHGIDFSAPQGTPVYAASSGVVLSADNFSLDKAFGNAVLIEHGDKLTSLSAHLSRLDVRMGDFVQAGQQIGLVGKTGRATGPHLHFEIWLGSVPQDPKGFLPFLTSSLPLNAN